MLMSSFITDIEQSRGIHRQNLFDGLVVFLPGNAVVFVVIHIARCDYQDGLGLPRQNVCDRVSKLLQNVELAGAESDGHEDKLWISQLQKR